MGELNQRVFEFAGLTCGVYMIVWLMYALSRFAGKTILGIIRRFVGGE